MEGNIAMKCNVTPYNGDERYMFVSYCHEDKTIVYPYIEMLAKRGFRVWYDEGIMPGDEWPETIAEKLSKCDFFLTFITENSLNSHNCRREVNYAIQKNKPFTGVFLEDVQLTVSMEMIFATYQGVYRNKYDTHEECLEVVYRNTPIYRCLGARNPDIIVHDLVEIVNKPELVPEKEETPLYDEFFLKGKNTEDKSSGQQDEIHSINPDEEQKNDGQQVDPVELIADEMIQDEVISEVDGEDLDNTSEGLDSGEEESAEHIPPVVSMLEGFDETRAFLYSFGRNNVFYIDKEVYCIGRSIQEADLVILNDTISKVHAIIQKIENGYYVKDNDSLNRVMVNGVLLNPKDLHKLEHLDLVSLGNEHLIYHEKEQPDYDIRVDVKLTSIATNETIEVEGPFFRIGRGNEYNDFVMKQSSISKRHAVVIQDKNKVYLIDLKSSNGSFINNKLLISQRRTQLKNNDLIRFGNQEFVVNIQDKSKELEN